MKGYFKLQYRMTNRRFKDANLEPLLAYVILTLGFVGASVYLFYKTEFAEYIYLLSALTLISKVSEKRKNDFLKICFGKSKFKKIRITENLAAALPFLIFLTYKQLFLSSLILIILAILLALANFSTTLSFAIPIPFYKKPFEFSVGFRNTFYLVLAAYVLTFIAVFINNFNLGIFAMLFVFAVALSYYTKAEDEYYVWIYSLNAKGFLFAKIKTSVLYSSFLIFPIALILGIFFHEHISTILLSVLIGWSFLVWIVVSKYSVYPDELNITHGIFLVLCISFPPLIIALIPYLFSKSQKRLGNLLK